MAELTKAEQARRTVLAALRASNGELTENVIRRESGVMGAWLAYALVGLLHEGAVEYLGPRMTEGGKAYLWRATPARPSPSYNDVGRDGHD